MMMLKAIRTLVFVITLSTVFTACKKDNEEKPTEEIKPPVVLKPKPTVTNVEIGTGNSKMAIRGKFIYFNADVTAVTKISSINLNIQQKKTEIYNSDYSSSVDLIEFKGLKNAKVVHKLFFSKNMPEGIYDLIFTVTDADGSELKLVEDLKIMDQNSVPVN